MSIWLEIHCDVHAPGHRSGALHKARCYTDENENIMGMARNASRVPYLLRALNTQAKSEGWKLKQGAWTCPGCAK